MSQTHFINVDLMIDSAVEPTALLAVFDRHNVVDLWEDRDHWFDGKWRGCFETYDQFDNPDGCIKWFLDIVEVLEESALSEWNACTVREFDVGYDAGFEPNHYMQTLSAETVRRIAGVGTSLKITIYAPNRGSEEVQCSTNKGISSNVGSKS